MPRGKDKALYGTCGIFQFLYPSSPVIVCGVPSVLTR